MTSVLYLDKIGYRSEMFECQNIPIRVLAVVGEINTTDYINTYITACEVTYVTDSSLLFLVYEEPCG